MQKVVIDLSTKQATIVEFTAEEIAEMEEQQLTQEFEQSLLPSQQEIEDAEFEIKVVNTLINLGVIG